MRRVDWAKGKRLRCVQEDGRLLRWHPGQRQGAGFSRHHPRSPSSALHHNPFSVDFPAVLARSSPAPPPNLTLLAQAFVRKVASAAGPLPSDMLLSDADALILAGDLAAASAALQV